MQDTVRGELDMVLHPEHGTSSAEAASEPQDHYALPTGDPMDQGATDFDFNGNGSSPPDIDRGFIGPPDSFT